MDMSAQTYQWLTLLLMVYALVRDEWRNRKK